MSKRTMWMMALVALLVVVLAGCTAGQGIAVPDRDVVISVDAALDAQNMAMGGLMMGSVELTESQFSSLLTELLKANAGAGNPVESITAWFEPSVLYLRVDVKEGVLPPAFGTTLEVAGSVNVQNNTLVIDLDAAAAGPYQVGEAVLAPLSAQINQALAGQPLGVPVSVVIGQGTMGLSLAQ